MVNPQLAEKQPQILRLGRLGDLAQDDSAVM